MRQVCRGAMVVLALAVASASGPVHWQAPSAHAGTGHPTSGVPSGPDLLRLMRAALTRAGSAHLSFHYSGTGLGPGPGRETGYADISSRERRARWVYTILPIHPQFSSATTTLPKLHERLIDTNQHRALQAGGAPWVCALQRSVDRSRDDLGLGLRTVHVLGVKRAMVARVPVWRVATTVGGLRKLSGRATYFIARWGFRLLRLALSASEHPGSSPIERFTGAVDYSAYGRQVRVHLPAGCHYVDVSASALRGFTVEGASMEPNLHNGQVIWVNSQAYRRRGPHRGDVIMFKAVPAGLPSRDFIKRVVGLPGELVAVRNRVISINHHPLYESYRHFAPNYSFGPRRVPPNRYFVLGDDRNDSYDSHAWVTPWLPRRDIIGKVLLFR